MVKLKVNEVFLSLQGEGLNQGLATVFVRLAGCNLYPDKCCSYCDTKYAQSSEGEELTPDEVVARIVKLSPWVKTRVCITGGEPLYQLEGLEDLVRTLNKYNYYIEVFTNGTLPRPFWYTRVNSWIVDIKTPSSGVNLTIGDWMDSRTTDQIKLTVGTEEDLKFAEDIISKMVFNYPKVIVSPVIDLRDFVEVGTTESNTLVAINREWLQRVAQFCIEHRVRYSLQLQKVLWGNKKGV
jgi:7-carboxy-7-deazaguanine synthase